MQKKLKHKLWKDVSIEKIPEFKFKKLEKDIKQINILSKKENIHLLDKINSQYTEDFMLKLEETLEKNKIPIVTKNEKENLFQKRTTKIKKNISKVSLTKEEIKNILSKNFEEEKNLNLDLMKPKKGNFSHSLKYYNNNEFLTYITNKHEKDENEINKILAEGRISRDNKIKEKEINNHMRILLSMKNKEKDNKNINGN